jgi:hypothetical protein
MGDRSGLDQAVERWQAVAVRRPIYRFLLPLISLVWMAAGAVGIAAGIGSGRWVLYWPMGVLGTFFGYLSYRVWRPKQSAADCARDERAASFHPP